MDTRALVIKVSPTIYSRTWQWDIGTVVVGQFVADASMSGGDKVWQTYYVPTCGTKRSAAAAERKAIRNLRKICKRAANLDRHPYVITEEGRQ